MINEQDIELIEKYLFGKLSEEEKTAYEQRLENDKEFADEVDFMRDLKVSSAELGKNQLRNTLKKIATNYKTNEIKAKHNQRVYMAIAASILVLVGITIVFYFSNNTIEKNTDTIVKLYDTTSTIEANQLIEQFASNTTAVTITSIEDGLGYAHTDSVVTHKLPVLIIPSEKYANSYLYRDTLFLFLTVENTPQFYSQSEQPNFLYCSQEKDVFYAIELKKETKLNPIKKVDDTEIVNRIKKSLENKY